MLEQLGAVEDVCFKLRELLRSEGWKVFQEYVRRDAAQALAATRGGVDSTQAVRVLAAYNTALQLVEWPEMAVQEGEKFRQAVEAQLADEK